MTSGCGSGIKINEPRIAVKNLETAKSSELEKILQGLPTAASYKEYREIPHDCPKYVTSELICIKVIGNVNVMGKISGASTSKHIVCDVCEIVISVNSWEQHVKGKRHNEQLSRQTRLEESSRRSLFVAGFPISTTSGELSEYFSKFANVSGLFMDKKSNKYAIVELNDIAGADRVFNLSHKFKNCWITVKRRSTKPKVNEKKNSKKNSQSPESKVDMKAIEQLLISSVDVESQFSTLIDAAGVTESETNEKLHICQKIENLMKEFFPDCQAIMYGSNVSFLGMIGCDMDVFLDLKIDVKPHDETNNNDEQTLTFLKDNLRNYRDCSHSDFLAQVGTLEAKNVVELLSFIIGKYFDGSYRICPIKSSRCPIVNFMYKSKCLCDLSIKNSLAVHNTLLIASYCKSDPRVHRVLFAIRVWAKQRNIVNSQCGRFSNYGITMLGLFYLQNCQPPVILTVEQLQTLAEVPIYCNGWECQFCIDKSKIPQTLNTQSAEDFTKQIENDERLSDFRTRTFNIQDPFELNFNLAANFAEQTVASWKEAISASYCLCSNLESWNKNDQEPWGLAKLLEYCDNSAKQSVVKQKKLVNITTKSPVEGSRDVAVENVLDTVEQHLNENNGSSQLKMHNNDTEENINIGERAQSTTSTSKDHSYECKELFSHVETRTKSTQGGDSNLEIIDTREDHDVFKISNVDVSQKQPLMSIELSSPSSNRSSRFHPYSNLIRDRPPLINTTLPSPPCNDLNCSLNAFNDNFHGVTPSKPKPSSIKAITKTFQIVTCSRFSICPCHSAAKQSAEVTDEIQMQHPLPPKSNDRLWTYDIMYKILTQALRLDCEKLTGLNEVTLEVNTQELILCKAFNNTWVGRKAARAATAINDFDPITSEGEVSNTLIKRFPPLTKDPLFICQCFLLCNDQQDQTTLDVRLELISTMNKEFVNFATFLKSFSQKMYKKLTTISILISEKFGSVT
ncbi:hypothetical protein CHUAL_011716 [Chamberlinius hualienensis]